ncbi:MAG: glucose-6-phosphate isomerase [Anaerolineaceae bacterium]|nr:glucose-6-phosphate isomerase [Anaerolineaceae bacterium]
MRTQPFTFELPFGGMPSEWDNHIQRSLSSMNGQYYDQAAYAEMLSENDQLLYEVYEVLVPAVEGELLHGVSILHPGKVGSEYFMTKGHFHSVLETGEVYYGMHGTGMMVMETPEGESSVMELVPGRVLYVPPRWAHRSVNTGATEDLITFFVYPGNAGHDYGTIEQKGFRKIVVEQDGKPTVIDNPRWQNTP